MMGQYDTFRGMMSDVGIPRVLAVFIAAWEGWKRKNGFLDFTDLVRQCLEHVGSAPGRPDVIFLDEAQDLSYLEVRLVRKWGRRAGMLILVGDPAQCLYEWRGTDPNAFTKPVLPVSQNLVLSQSYRVPVRVHARALEWINRLPNGSPIEYLPKDEEGLVAQIKATWKQPSRVIADAGNLLATEQETMIIASCGYMLRPIIGELRSLGVPFHNPYRLKEKEWNPLSATSPSGVIAHRLACFLSLKEQGVWTGHDIKEWASILRDDGVLGRLALSVAKDRANAEDFLISRDGLVPAVPEEVFVAGLSGDLQWYSRHLKPAYARAAAYPLTVARNGGREKLLEAPKVVLGTIHSTKGAESDVVYLFPDISPAALKQWNGRYSRRAEIVRMFYVGMTRARRSLNLCSPADLRVPRL